MIEMTDEKLQELIKKPRVEIVRHNINWANTTGGTVLFVTEKKQSVGF